MMNTTVRCGAAGVLLVLSVACGSAGPTSPSGTSQPQSLPSATPPDPITFPPLSGPSRTFIFDGELTYLLRSADRRWRPDVSEHTRNSRFVLYDNGAFELQYPTLGERGYRGQYHDAGSGFLFEFQGFNVGNPFHDATGILKGDSLTVHYSEIMEHSDFESAVYVLMR